MNRKPEQIYIFLACVLISVLFTGLYFSLEKEESTSEAKYWVIKEYEGHPAVFDSLNEKPSEILDINISSLPSSDRILLREGIRVYSENELSRLIEDYSS